MNRTDRLLAIVLELQGKGRQRAEDLAATFETSKRTIYRDIQALGQAGVPLMSTPGRGYSLMAGYFLPPLSFSTDEATMLLLGSGVIREHFDAQYRAAAESASRKILGVLPEKLRAEVQALQESIHFVESGVQAKTQEQLKLQHLRRAILQRTRVRFRYHRRQGAPAEPEPDEREADPYALVHVGDAWYLTAYCHLRQGIRHFRLDRMDDLALLTATFTRPVDFSVSQAYAENDRFTLVVRALFAAEVARWVREAPSFFTVSMEDTSGGLLVTLQMRHERDVLQWLLSWGRSVRVLEPASLQRLIAEEARAIAQAYQSPED
ncbi:MAG TPA: YafY family protein [Ktedonobacterales bacterium]|jgi:predicted DNA-binding transcriptional regulator YafY